MIRVSVGSEMLSYFPSTEKNKQKTATKSLTPNINLKSGNYDRPQLPIDVITRLFQL